MTEPVDRYQVANNSPSNLRKVTERIKDRDLDRSAKPRSGRPSLLTPTKVKERLGSNACAS